MQVLSQAPALPGPAKYRIFERIRFSDGTKSITGIITGLEYLSPTAASVEASDTDGYMYVVRREIGDGLQAWWVPEDDIISNHHKRDSHGRNNS
ncbi:MAG: hypothetical protein AAF215_05435 [Cyanobacteria bacterium P01_A01_bin.123]